MLNMKNNFLKGIKEMRGGALLPVEEGGGRKELKRSGNWGDARDTCDL